ncbi:hypothetical protein DIPPA_00201 [Diplonema papillatum]|nr:hypothetical protein DIPPA_00201 [Diplonema papillatum]
MRRLSHNELDGNETWVVYTPTPAPVKKKPVYELPTKERTEARYMNGNPTRSELRQQRLFEGKKPGRQRSRVYQRRQRRRRSRSATETRRGWCSHRRRRPRRRGRCTSRRTGARYIDRKPYPNPSCGSKGRRRGGREAGSLPAAPAMTEAGGILGEAQHALHSREEDLLPASSIRERQDSA